MQSIFVSPDFFFSLQHHEVDGIVGWCVCFVWLQASSAESFCVASAVEGQSWIHQPSVQGRAEPVSGYPETQHHPLLLQVSHCSQHTRWHHMTVFCHRKVKVNGKWLHLHITKQKYYTSFILSLSTECGRDSITTWRNQRLLASHLPTSCLP